MNALHYCKTKTHVEYDPSLHEQYKIYLEELKHQEDSLAEARSALQPKAELLFVVEINRFVSA